MATTSIPTEPTAAQLNARNAAIGAPATPTGAYAGGGNNSYSGGGGGTPSPSSSTSSVSGPAPVVPNGSGTPAVTTVTGNGSTTQPVVSGVSPDSAYSQAQANLAPNAKPTPPTEEDFFAQVQQQLAPVLASITDAEQAAEYAATTGANQTALEETSAMNFGANARGLAGSSEANSQYSTINANRNTTIAQAVAQAKQAQSQAIQAVTQFAIPEAYKEYSDALSRNDQLSQNYINQTQATLTKTLSALAANGITNGAQLLQENPQAYYQYLQYFNGDTTALSSALTMAQPQQNVIQSWNQGSSYYQLVKNPITGGVSVQSTDTGVTVPTSWTTQKVSTSTILQQDPSNPMNSVTYSTNPFTGEVSVTGSGTGSQIATQYNAQNNGSSGSTPSQTSTTTAGAPGSATTTISSILGVDPSTPLSSVVSSSGIGSVVAAIIKNEGGSPAEVQNNPGNIKFTGAPGQTDSGVKASDGGTFASYQTTDAGTAAIAQMVQNPDASIYGTNPTLQSFVDKYTNTGTAQVGTNGLSTAQYGALANVPGFNPNAKGTQGAIDSDAFNYLKSYLGGTTPGSSAGMGGAATFQMKQAIQARAEQLYTQATGKQLPEASQLADLNTNINSNQDLINSLNVQTGTIQKNFGLSLANMTANNVNQAPPAINGVMDFLMKQSGSTSVAQYLTQNATLSNEIGNLFSLKNASGSTVADKLAGAEANPSDLSIDQQKQILSTVMQEARNQQQSITAASLALYAQTDPLGINPQNPVNMPGYQEASNRGYIPNGDGTYTSPDGTTTVDGQGNPIQ